MGKANGDRNLETRLEALRRDLAAATVTLCNLGQRLEELMGELRSRHQVGKVIALDRRRRDACRDDPDILGDFLK